ncbi:hypothetical protein GCM10025868_29030 [Angustibacter aerolatus]|uniref:ABC transporter ATP-binding protein n=1 Tax=Angustibacter aerolatus TaxID=1162965 RepID=A0ABQ6JHH5_9ACTN|nr:hypothetical protein GCM10025868_29030 [Angustibacter aerolatus]
MRGLTGTVLMSSHVVEDVEDLADRVLVLDGGRLVFDGTTDRLAGLATDDGRRSRLESGFLHVTGQAVS